MNLDSIKQQLISQGVTVWPDMQAPVAIYDDVARACKSRVIQPGMTEQDIVDFILEEGTQVAFKGIHSVTMTDPQRNPQGSVLHIRYAAWN